MAFTSSITDRDVYGRMRVHHGTFTSSGGSTGGNINTGLTKVKHMTFCVAAAAVGNSPVVNETLPCDGNAVTIVSDADETGTWMAIGR